MNGPLRQGMLPSNNIGQQQNMLSIGNPSPFMQNPGSLVSQQASGSNPLGMHQNMPPNPPMGMLSGGPVPPGAVPRYPMQSNSMQQQPLQQQQRPMVPRQGQNPAQLNPAANNPSSLHMQSQLQSLPFAPNMMQQSLAGNNATRRVQSQPHININSLGSMPPSVANSMGMGMNPQAGMSTQIRQGPGQQQQNPQVHHIRMQQQQPQQMMPQSNMSDIMIRNQAASNSVMQANMGARMGPTQAQVMSSLTQPSSLGSTPLPGNMPPAHQNAFSNGTMPHPQLSTSPRPTSQGMPMSTPVQSHTSANRLRTSPDMFMGYPGSQFPGNATGRAVPPSPSSSSYPFGPTSPPPMQLSNIPRTSPPNLMSAQGGGPTNKAPFFPTPAQQQLDMSGMDMFSPSFSSSMPPPPTIPSQLLSHGSNSLPLPSTPQAPSMLNPQQRVPRASPSPQQGQQPQGGHQLPPDQMNISVQGASSQPQRPRSQGSGALTSGSQPPRGMQPSISHNSFAAGLTVAGRIQPSQQPSQGLAQPQQQMPTAPRPPQGPAPPSGTGGAQRLPTATSPEQVGGVSATSPPPNSDQVGTTGRPLMPAGS